jgi:hypothetical protein
MSELFNDRFHGCALLAGRIAWSEGRLGDRSYVQRLAYELYERGAFRGRAPSDLTSPCSGARTESAAGKPAAGNGKNPEP